MEPRVFEYKAWVNEVPEKSAEELQRIVKLSYAMTGLLGLLAAICLAVLVSVKPLQLQLLAGLIVLTGGAVMLFRKADTNRRNLARTQGDTVSSHGPYPLSLTDTHIHFPESFDDPEDDWPLVGTEAVLRTVSRQEILALSHPGRKPRHFYGNALKDDLESVLAEIEARQASATPAANVTPKPEQQA